MTDTATTPTQTPRNALGADLQIQPADILMNLIVVLLAPMFLMASDGDILLARMAAFETINAYRARNQADLIAIAQIVACGLAGLGSLSLSMADDISLSMTLSLRGNAVALNRTAEQSRRSLKEIRQDAAPSNTGQQPDDFDEAALIAGVADARQHCAPTPTPIQSGAATPGPTPVPAEPKAPAASRTPTQQQRQAMPAATVAGECTASPTHLPPVEPKMASLRATALSSCANNLLFANGPPRLAPNVLSRSPSL